MIHILNITVLFLALGAIGLSNQTPPEKASHEPVAVVELFTSEGCSSCPSADRLLTETLAEASKNDRNVIGLSFHVDYWDRLGWKDPFSNHAFTQRQYQYGARFGLSGVYTPQEVLNGQQEFVGSNRAKQSSLLEAALHQPATAGVALSVTASSPNARTVNYQLDGDLTNAVLNVALVTKTAVTNVGRGENAGRKLTHNNVVRAFQTVPAAAHGTVTLNLPAGFDPANGAVIAYVQGKERLDVRGASQLNL